MCWFIFQTLCDFDILLLLQQTAVTDARKFLVGKQPREEFIYYVAFQLQVTVRSQTPDKWLRCLFNTSK